MNNWDIILKEEFEKEYFKKITTFLENTKGVVFPKKENFFKALELTPLDKVKVVILGQDPYHEPNQAMGLAFSVPRGEKIPPSLRNIYKELESDLNMPAPTHGDLTKWAEQGVLLLNTVLTVEEHKALSHHKIGWQIFTDRLIYEVCQLNQPIVFILLGNEAKTKKEMIKNPNHLIIESVHPSPLSANKGFFGSKIFSKTNNYLIKNNLNPIDWYIN